MQQQGRRSDVAPDILSGINAYAAKQAALTCALAQSFADQWYPVLCAHNIPIEWPSQFIPRMISTSVDID